MNHGGLGERENQKRKKKKVPEFLQILPYVHFPPYLLSYSSLCVTIINLFHEYTYMLNPVRPPSKVPMEEWS